MNCARLVFEVLRQKESTQRAPHLHRFTLLSHGMCIGVLINYCICRDNCWSDGSWGPWICGEARWWLGGLGGEYGLWLCGYESARVALSLHRIRRIFYVVCLMGTWMRVHDYTKGWSKNWGRWMCWSERWTDIVQWFLLVLSTWSAIKMISFLISKICLPFWSSK